MEETTDLELTVLEELFNEETRCEMRHFDSVCSGAATHVARDCRKPLLVCETGTKLIKQMMHHKSRCTHCQLPAAACWSIIPV